VRAGHERGQFFVSRLDEPRLVPEVLEGRWAPPPIRRVH